MLDSPYRAPEQDSHLRSQRPCQAHLVALRAPRPLNRVSALHPTPRSTDRIRWPSTYIFQWTRAPSCNRGRQRGCRTNGARFKASGSPGNSRSSPRSAARARSRRSFSAYDAGSPRTFPSGWCSKASPQPTWPTNTRDNNRLTTSSARTRPAASGALKRELPASGPASAARPIRPVDRMTGGSGFGPRYSFQFLAGS
jgi:hypothetical protein